jgi:hypothetical protein
MFWQPVDLLQKANIFLETRLQEYFRLEANSRPHYIYQYVYMLTEWSYRILGYELSIKLKSESEEMLQLNVNQ